MSDETSNQPSSHVESTRTPAVIAGWVAVAVVVACYLWFQVLPLLGDRGTGIPGLFSHQNDFKHLYLGSVLLAQGLSPYDPANMLMLAGQYSAEDPRFRTILPYVYLPFTGVVLRPLAALPFATAVVVFQVVNHACILGGIVLGALAGGWKSRRPWVLALFLALAAFNFTVYRQNNAGQLNAMLLAGAALLALGIVRRWHPAAIGAIAAFLMLFKLSPGIFLLWFLVRREWSRAAWMAGIAVLFTLVTIGVCGFDRHMEFLPMLAEMGYGRSTWAGLGQAFWRDPYNISFNALFHRLFVERPGSGIAPWIAGSSAMANVYTWIAWLAILGIFGAATWRSDGREREAVALAVLTSLLLPSIFWDHYLVQALLPAVLLLLSGRGWPARVAIVACVAVMAMPLAMDADQWKSGAGLLMQNAKLIPVLVLFAMAAWPMLACRNCGNPDSARDDSANGSLS